MVDHLQLREMVGKLDSIDAMLHHVFIITIIPSFRFRSLRRKSRVATRFGIATLIIFAGPSIGKGEDRRISLLDIVIRCN